LKADGILGPETWARLRAALPADNRGSFPARSQLTSFIPTPVEFPGGGRIKDKTEIGQAELVTVKGFGGKPIKLHRLAADAWTALVNAARSDSFGAPLLLPTSGFRSDKRQEVLWQEALRKHGSREKAREWVAPPGRSAHKTGRAIDLYLGDKNSSENAANLRKLSVYRWLVANAARFGFYPYEREPWHWEYNPPAQRHEQEKGEYILLNESDEFPGRLDKEEFDQETLEALAEYHGGEPQVVEQVSTPVPAATRVGVTVRTDFAIRTAQGIDFHWAPGEALRNARIEIIGTNISGATDGQGAVSLTTTGLQDGIHTLRITHVNADQASNDDVGPAIADPLNHPPPRIYRPLDIGVTASGAVLAAANVPAGTRYGGIGNRIQHNWQLGRLPVDWKPVWMRSPLKPGEGPRRVQDITLIVVHHTGGMRIGPAINTFLNPREVSNAHYISDLNGHIIKLAEDSRRANHAGRSRWGGVMGVNGFSIGIEIVHRSGVAFSAAQYDALISLIQRLRNTYSTIDSHRIVAHSDIATTSAAQPELLSNRRADDPGEDFDWEQLEQRGLGMRPVSTDLGNYYGGIFFGHQPIGNVALQRGDHDQRPGLPPRYGGRARPDIAGNVIQELQEDLEHIGYSLRPVGGHFGEFDVYTERAVDRFQRHFFSGNRKVYRVGRLGRVDALSANWIKTVRAGVP
jgi:N-acetyl-anhydromuramyl-L-alanine amidase AmpD